MPHVVPPEVLDACVLELAGPPDRRRRDEFYGLRRELLDEVGPSVVSINGAAASLAVSEFMLAATGVRAPNRLLTYNGRTGKVTVSTDEPARRVSVIH
jgi:hypothetical protein